MNLHVFCIHIIIVLLLPYALLESIPEANEIGSELEENEKSDEIETLHETNHHSLKHHAKNNHMKRHNRGKRADDTLSKKRQCAVMYKNGEPVGVLQPFKDSYQLLPIHSDESVPVEISPIDRQEVHPANKRETDVASAGNSDDESVKKEEESTSFAEEKYPYIFAKFKIDSKLDREGSQKTKNLQKREYKNSALFSEKHVNSLRSTLSRIETNDEGAEAELKGILSDMGLIDDSHIEKRDAELLEDEDLEHGTNKINLIMMENNNERHERSASKSKGKKHYDLIDIPEPKSVNEDEYIDQYMKQHPEEFDQPEKKDREKRSEDVAEQMERQIKERLQKIKEEVRDEIESIKANNIEESDEDSENEEEEKVESQRRKRNVVSNLVDEETSDLNPVLFGENNLTPHIRRRRSIVDDENIVFEDRDDSKNSKDEIHKEEMESNHRSTDKARLKLGGIGVTMNPVSDNYEDTLIIDLIRDGLSDKHIQQFKSLKKRNTNTNLAKDNKLTGDERSKGNFNYGPAIPKLTNHFLRRNLKDYKGETNSNYEDSIDDSQNDNSEISSDENAVRNKKACKCEGGHCKCGHSKSLVGTDESNVFYFDGVPQWVPAPFDNEPRKEDDEVYMRLLRRSPDKTRPLRQNEGRQLSKIATNIVRGLRDGGYMLDIDPDVYKITEEKSNSLQTRKKRNSFVDLVAIHGDDPVINHLVAIRERSMLPKTRAKRMADDSDKIERPLTLTDMSDNDLFGALPQSYNGELARYKRVKRTDK